jgi:hypothetical protein
MKSLIAMAVLALAPVGAMADEVKPACSIALNTTLPEAWKDWTTPETVPAAATPATQPEILLGRAYTAPLKPTASVDYAAPSKKTKDGTFGGLFMLTIEKAGVHVIALDQAAWIDVVRDGKVIKSSGNGHGPDCTTIRKTVEFKLDPGHYTVQISNAPKDTALIEVIAKP